MDALHALKTRRSIRQFTAEPVPNEKILTILECAMYAPSACNQQPWQFVVIDDREILDAIPPFHPYANMLKEAPLAVVVCSDARLETIGGYWEQDCSAAMENLLLAVHAVDLGGVWLGVHPLQERVEKLRELLNLPKEVTPLGIAAIGYPAETKGKVERYLKDRVHHNNWQTSWDGK
ncbi:nitroreductase family protein [bacterium]|nr:nitroreductase family protein [bacterium]